MMWEYETVKLEAQDLDENLKRYGESGWKLAAVVSLAAGYYDYRLFFKRRREPGLR